MLEKYEEGLDDAAATTFIARELQSDFSRNDYWPEISTRIRSFLATAYPPRKLHSRYTNEDLCQDVFVRLLEDLPKREIPSREAFWALVSTYARNSWSSFFREMRAEKRGAGVPDRRLGSVSNSSIGGAEVPGVHDSGSGHLRAAEIEACEMACVAKLGRERDRTVYLLRRPDGLKFEEIALRVGVRNAVTVRAIFRRAKRQVLACLIARLGEYSDYWAGLDGHEPTE